MFDERSKHYQEWFGIPKSEQPPDHYRLLGLKRFEDSIEKIEDAVARRVDFLQAISLGADVEAAQQILNEVAMARLCLVNPKLKKDYDAKLAKPASSTADAPAIPFAKTLDTGPPVAKAVAELKIALNRRKSQSQSAKSQPESGPSIAKSPPPVKAAPKNTETVGDPGFQRSDELPVSVSISRSANRPLPGAASPVSTNRSRLLIPLAVGVALLMGIVGGIIWVQRDSDPVVISPVPSELPQVDARPANQARPVRVFILMGEANMLGMGRVEPEDKQGTLSYLVRKQNKYRHLVDDQGAWVERPDVRYVQVADGGSGYQDVEPFKTVQNQWLTVTPKTIGPELQFGHVVGHALDDPVLIIKSCSGNRSLGWDLLPPGSKPYEYEGRVYAGYKDSPSHWVKGQPKKSVNWYAGRQYDADVAHAKGVLENLGDYFPGYQGQGYEITGFVWWQGVKDRNDAGHAQRYEANLVQLIKSLRRDFDAPQAKFVLATVAVGGNQLSGHGLTIASAQLAVSGDGGKYREFQGNVKTVDARPFWRDAKVSPSNTSYFYNHNAETSMEVGEALGRAMVELLNRK